MPRYGEGGCVMVPSRLLLKLCDVAAAALVWYEEQVYAEPTDEERVLRATIAALLKEEPHG